jgi:hypothetical protein
MKNKNEHIIISNRLFDISQAQIGKKGKKMERPFLDLKW